MIPIVDHVNEMAGSEPESKKFECLGLLSSKELTPLALEKAIHSLLAYDLRARKKAEDISFEGDEKEIYVLVHDRRHIWIKRISDSFYLAVIVGLPGDETETLRWIFLRIPWIVSSWLKPDYLDRLHRDRSVKEYDRVTVEKEYDPYFLRKKYSDVPAKLDNERELFYEEKVEIRVKAPKILIEKYFKEILREKIAETVKTKVVINLNNPGASTITVDEKTHVVHKSGEPRATEAFLIDTLEMLKKDMAAYDKFAPRRRYTYIEDGSRQLEEYTPGEKMTFIFDEALRKYSREELWIKLMNLLIYGDEKLTYSPHGRLVESGDLEFMTHTFLPVDKSEFFVHFEGKDKPKLDVLPVYSTRIGLLTLHRILSKRIDWKVRLG